VAAKATRQYRIEKQMYAAQIIAQLDDRQVQRLDARSGGAELPGLGKAGMNERGKIEILVMQPQLAAAQRR
jgi:hypothetical protein